MKNNSAGNILLIGLITTALAVLIAGALVSPKMAVSPTFDNPDYNTETITNEKKDIDVSSVYPVESKETTESKSITTIDSTKDTLKNNSSISITETKKYEVVVLAGGCFWCTEAYFQEEMGVIDAVSGYAGGKAETADYKTVSLEKTAHREAVQVTFDPTQISFKEILDIYWSHIDPTDAGGQFADRGTQYTTAIFYNNETQKQIAEDSKDRLEKSGLFDKPIAVKVLPLTTFFPAEDYHQDYYKKASDHYNRYKKASGRAGFVEETWAKDAAIYFLNESN